MISWFDNSSVFTLNIENLQKRRNAQQNEEAEARMSASVSLVQKESLRARVTQQVNQNAVN